MASRSHFLSMASVSGSDCLWKGRDSGMNACHSHPHAASTAGKHAGIEGARSLHTKHQLMRVAASGAAPHPRPCRALTLATSSSTAASGSASGNCSGGSSCVAGGSPISALTVAATDSASASWW